MGVEWRNVRIKYKSEGKKEISGPITGRAEDGGIHAIFANDYNLAHALLETIAFHEPESGEVTLAGHPRPKDWVRRIAFIPHIDNLAGKLTVREHLEMDTNLKFWQSTTRVERREIVKKLLAYFKLEDLRDRRVLRLGTPKALDLVTRKTLMLGKIKLARLLYEFIAIEACHNVDVVVAVDPLKNMTVDESISFLSTLCDFSRDREIPVIINLQDSKPEYFQFITGVTVIFEKTKIQSCSKSDFLALIDLHFQGASLERKLEAFSEFLFGPYTCPEAVEQRYSTFKRLDCASKVPNTPSSGPIKPTLEWPAPWYAAFYNLLRYQVRGDVRSRKYIFGLVFTSFVIYMTLSFVFFQLPSTANGLADRAGLLYFLSINLLISNSLSTIVKFDHALGHFALDKKIKLFHSGTFIWAQFASFLPARSLLVIILGTSLYYITGLRTDGFQHLVVFISDLLLMTYVSVTIGMLVQLVSCRLEYSQIVMPFFIVTSFIFGNLSTAPDATWILRWLQYLTPIYYSFQCLIQNELVSTTAEDGTDVAAFLDNGKYNTMPIAACLPALAGFALVFLFLSTIVYHFRYRAIKLNNL